MNTSTESTDMHTYFGLSYANYLVINRTLLQSMPERWQHAYVALLNELDDAFAHVNRAPTFQVTPGRPAYIDELDRDQLRALGYTIGDDCYYTPDGEELVGEEADAHLVFVPMPDPVPHYDRGRAYIAPEDRSGR